MKAKQKKHFYWGPDPKSDTTAAEGYARYLLKADKGGTISNMHVWRDPAGRRTTVEWIEES
jgi:hypothetical protein